MVCPYLTSTHVRGGNVMLNRGMMMSPLCIGCNKHPSQLDEYTEIAAIENMEVDDYVRKEEGTYNHVNGHFLCTDCYCKAGMPSSPNGWVAP